MRDEGDEIMDLREKKREWVKVRDERNRVRRAEESLQRACFWTWPFGHVWGAFQLCEVCGKDGY